MDVPIDFPADYVDFAKPGLPREPERLLLAGRDAEGRGVLVWIRVEGREPAQWSVLDTFHQPASDFVGVAYAAQTQRLYVLELRSQTIYRASFSPSAEKLPTKWSALAHSSQFGDPGDLGLRALSLSRDGAEPQLWVYNVNSEMLNPVRRDTPIVIDGQHGVSFDVHSDGGRRAAIGTRELRLGMQAVPLVGSPALNAELVRLDGAQGIQVIGRAQLDDAGNGVVSLIETPLQFGAVYGARNPLSRRISFPFLTPEKRWGKAQVFRDGRGIQPLRSMGMAAYVGADSFRVPCFLELKAEPQREASSGGVPATLIVGDETSPILDLGGVAVLGGSFVWSSRLESSVKAELLFTEVRLPIPADPLLAWLELRFQWLIEDGDGLRVSDIAGIQVRPARFDPPGAEVLPPSEAPPVLAPSEGQRSREAAFRSWLESCGGRALSEELTRELRSRIRH
ncbi:MAG: hypothetical protein JNM84_18865 [Planctomycetes bacterium]|nr:hypothetical protein [Planctomycetota bacterium]